MLNIKYMYYIYYCTYLPMPESAAEVALPLAVEGFPGQPASVFNLLISRRFFRTPDQKPQLMADLDAEPMVSAKDAGG